MAYNKRILTDLGVEATEDDPGVPRKDLYPMTVTDAIYITKTQTMEDYICNLAKRIIFLEETKGIKETF